MSEHHFFQQVAPHILCDDPSSLVDLRRCEVSREMRKWLPDDGGIVLASSGGADSLAMAVATRMVIDDPCRVTMVHIDHGIRKNAERDRICAMLQSWALGFRFEYTDVWVPRIGNLYEQGRHCRYAAIAASAFRHGACVVMTAHHADDLIETMMMRLARGCPIRNAELVGRATRIFGMEVVRPLLSIPRSDLRKLAAQSGIPWSEDPSNEDTSRERALIRSTVGSALARYRQDFMRMAARSLLAERASDSH